MAFDHVHPRLALGIYAALGMNAAVLRILENVWCHRQRFLTLDDQVLDYPESVQTSVPQGDSFSLMAMLAVLVGPTHDLVARHPQVTLRTCVDDRTFTGPAAAVLAMKNDWRQWSDALGLVENQAKTIHFHRTQAGRAAFRALVVPADAISTNPKILGCDLKPAHKDVSLLNVNKIGCGTASTIFAKHSSYPCHGSASEPSLLARGFRELRGVGFGACQINLT